MKLLSLGPNFYIHVSGNDLYIPTICLFWNLIPYLNQKKLTTVIYIYDMQFSNLEICMWALYVNSRLNPRSGELSLAVQQNRYSK